jgi:hypothetical protein
MAGLTSEERQRLTAVIARRLGARSDASGLVDAYLDAVERHAFARTCDSGPVPTSLNVERSAVLVEISRQLKRVIEDFEIEALFRVTRTQARTMRTTLLASYSDVTDDLTLTWALVGARRLGRYSEDSLVGTEIQFGSEERRDAFASQLERSGTPFAILLGDQEKPWRAAVSDEFPKELLPPVAGK